LAVIPLTETQVEKREKTVSPFHVLIITSSAD